MGNRVEPVFQLVYCLDRQTGLERFATLKPFSEPGTSALHTLGAIEKENKLFVIGQSGKGGAGIAAFDLAVGKRLWVNPLNHVSGSLVLSAPSQRLYIMKKDSLLASTMEFMALDTSSSKGVVINSIASKSIPLPSLGAVGPGGVYFPTPSGFIRYSE